MARTAWSFQCHFWSRLSANSTTGSLVRGDTRSFAPDKTARASLRLYAASGANVYGRGSPRPVLVIWGEADATVPFANAKKLIALMPHAKLYSYPLLGHNITFSQAPTVAGLMLQFLNAQDKGASSATGSSSLKLGTREHGEEVR